MRLVPDPAGCLTAASAISVPFSTPRLQGTFGPGWCVEEVALWGAGPLGRIRLLPGAAVLEARALPNRLALLGPEGRFEAEALPDLPCLVLDVEHTTASLHLQLSPASLADRAPDGATTWAIDADCVFVHLPWAVVAVASNGGVATRRGLK
ncbi:MAG: hypothetical protein M3R21_07250, partial [Candidatus Dormibacteraeota bacterium]|nr:hypothetical protein [Candidatus Dormibacteraeota bacterium]